MRNKKTILILLVSMVLSTILFAFLFSLHYFKVAKLFIFLVVGFYVSLMGIVIIDIINQKDLGKIFKILWMVFVICFPIIGTSAYLLIKRK